MATLVPNKNKSRGLDDLKRRVGDIAPTIEARIRQNKRVRILEVGCGYGMALLELSRRYGDRVELYGINKTREHGDPETMKAIAVDSGLYSEAEVQSLALPEYFIFDVCAPWPLPSDFFDIVFSQHAFLWFADKIKPLEEIHRVLRNDGVALLDLLTKRPGTVSANSIVILNGVKDIPFVAYAQQFDNITINFRLHSPYQRFWRWITRKMGRRTHSIQRRSFLKMKKTKHLDFNLEFVACAPFSARSSRKGCQSFYRLKK